MKIKQVLAFAASLSISAVLVYLVTYSVANDDYIKSTRAANNKQNKTFTKEFHLEVGEIPYITPKNTDFHASEVNKGSAEQIRETISHVEYITQKDSSIVKVNNGTENQITKKGELFTSEGNYIEYTTEAGSDSIEPTEEIKIDENISFTSENSYTDYTNKEDTSSFEDNKTTKGEIRVKQEIFTTEANDIDYITKTDPSAIKTSEEADIFTSKISHSDYITETYTIMSTIETSEQSENNTPISEANYEYYTDYETESTEPTFYVNNSTSTAVPTEEGRDENGIEYLQASSRLSLEEIFTTEANDIDYITKKDPSAIKTSEEADIFTSEISHSDYITEPYTIMNTIETSERSENNTSISEVNYEYETESIEPTFYVNNSTSTEVPTEDGGHENGIKYLEASSTRVSIDPIENTSPEILYGVDDKHYDYYYESEDE